ncbi:MAG TPA: class I SAM-dependent methyltransferase [Rhodocyclaceae bacterium]|nr:class I SAM-dependent methyltransferase [Rhodocyclaceae bacterium]
MKKILKEVLNCDAGLAERNAWLKKTIGGLSKGMRILDAGAGELRNKPLCTHLDYVSQDFCQYDGVGNGVGLQVGSWDTRRIDIVSDIVAIPEPDGSFDAVLCSEVLEHVPDPLQALAEFSRLLKPGGVLILTAPFASLVHFAPYHFCSGFGRYWYEHHLPPQGFAIEELSPNGDWFSFSRQELIRLPQQAFERRDWCWPLAYLVAGIGLLYYGLRQRTVAAQDVACIGWHCVAIKQHVAEQL